MGSTTHGIKYPEMPDLPDVPDDIGGALKLDQTTQTWLATLDATNLAALSTANSGATTQAGNVSTANTAISTGVTRQSAQASAVTAIQTRNTNVTARLDARDASLLSEQSTVTGYAGQISSLTVQKGYGLQGYFSNFNATQIGPGGSWTQFGAMTLTNPYPTANRMFRVCLQLTLYDSSGLSGVNYPVSTALFMTAGTTFNTSIQVASSYIEMDTYVNRNATAYMEGEFNFNSIGSTGLYTLWAAALPVAGVQYQVGDSADFMTVEDVGLQL